MVFISGPAILNEVRWALGRYVPHVGGEVGHHVAKGVEGAQRQLNQEST